MPCSLKRVSNRILDRNPREGDPVVVPNRPYFVNLAADLTAPEHLAVGEHGYDATRVPEMKANIFCSRPGHSAWSSIEALREREPSIRSSPGFSGQDSRSRYHEPEDGPGRWKTRCAGQIPNRNASHISGCRAKCARQLFPLSSI